MAVKVKLTRPELKRYRDELARYRRYLPMLKLKQQQLQVALRGLAAERAAAQRGIAAAEVTFRQSEPALRDTAGVAVRKLAAPEAVVTGRRNIAGVTIPVLEEVRFAEPTYSLFGTPAWVDLALEQLRALNRCRAQLEVLDEQYRLLRRELMRIVQRVNLFEEVKIPAARDAIRVIRIKLGDEMAAAVGRAKIAKAKLTEAATREEGDEEEAATPGVPRP